MIIVRSPLRITLGGGGSDIPAYYREHGGFCIAAAIDKYVYVTVTRPFFRNIFLKYSQLERVAAFEDVKHPIIREALLQYGDDPQIEITSLADIPAGTGLGSSSSFTTALIKALCVYYRNDINSKDLAEKACEIEIDLCHEPIGKQDQYMAVFGGLTALTFYKDHGVKAENLRLSPDNLYALEDNLLLFFTGIQRKTADALQEQPKAPNLPDMGYAAGRALYKADHREFAEHLNEQWKLKTVSPQIAEWRELGLKNGAIGGKLVGAGGGGFLLFYAEDATRLRRAMANAGLQELRFRFDYEGTKVLVS